MLTQQPIKQESMARPGGQEKSAAKSNKASTLLSQEENEAVHSLLSKKCQVLRIILVLVHK